MSSPEPPETGPPSPADEPAHRRRPRYRGTHPRAFDERYKELAPERYPDEITKVRARGHTPAGSHVPVMAAQVLEILAPRPGEIALDCTLGHGGHAAMIAERVAPGGFVVGLDWDEDELARTAGDLERRGLPVRTHRGNFAGAPKALEAEGLTAVDMVLADLGVSSMQIDRPERGFSLKRDGPLDMRMDRTRGIPLAEWLGRVEEAELAGILTRFGDEEDADAIAAAIVARRTAGRPLRRTAELVELVLRTKHIDPRTFRQESAQKSHPAAQTFQALRIAVNRELENLAQLLRSLPWILRPGGRAAIITFHSGEAALVTDALASGAARGEWSSISAEPRVPPRDEVHQNPRARSARLHWAIRGS